MMRRGGAKAASSLLKAARPRLFSTATTSTIRSISHETSHLLRPVVTELASPSGMSGWIWTTRAPAIGGARFASTVTLGEKTTTTDANPKKEEKESSIGGDAGGDKGGKGIASYWGVEPSKITKEDGTEWKWNCFRVRFMYNRYMFINI